MAKNEPVVLELASLPRDQMGAFLILGLDKAGKTSLLEKLKVCPAGPDHPISFNCHSSSSLSYCSILQINFSS